MRAALFAGLLVACVGADQAVPLGSVAFSLEATPATRIAVNEAAFLDGYTLVTQKVLLSLKTVTIGEATHPDACSYRGRGAVSNVVFDPRLPVSQIFNGLAPGGCPDVGIIFGPPDDSTTIGQGVTGDDVLLLASGSPAHAYVEAVATRGADSYRVILRFDTARASSHYAGCRSSAGKGALVTANERQSHVITFGVDTFFRQAIASVSFLRFQPFIDADLLGNADGIVTMDELDALPLSAVRIYSDFYQLPNGSRTGSFGDYVRAQLKFAFRFDDDGQCFGNDPGEDDFQP